MAQYCSTPEGFTLCNGRQSDLSRLLVGSGVSTSRHNDGGRELVGDLKINAVEMSIGSRQHDLSKVGLLADEGENSLCLRVSEADVVLQDLRASLGHHQTGEQDSAERHSYIGSANYPARLPAVRFTLASQAINGGLQDGLVDELEDALGRNASGRVAAHSSSVGAEVSVENALVVLRRGERLDVISVTEGQDAQLVALQELLNHNLSAYIQSQRDQSCHIIEIDTYQPHQTPSQS